VLKVSHFSESFIRIESKPSVPAKKPDISIPATSLKAAEILLRFITSPSSSVPVSPPSEASFLTSPNLETIVFNAVPAVSGDSCVVSIIYVKNAEVVSNSIPADLASEATLVIAVEISSTLAAALAARAE